MINKKILIIIPIVVVIFITGIFFIKNKRISKSGSVEGQIIDLLNSGKTGFDIAENNKEIYEYAIKDLSDVEWNVDYFIKKHVEFLNDCILVKEGEKTSLEITTAVPSLKELFSLVQEGKEITTDMMTGKSDYVPGIGLNKTPNKGSYRSDFVDFIVKNMTEQDIKDYYDNKFEEKILKKLEKVFTHRSKELYEGWYIKNKENRNIDLLYGLYAEFLPDYKKNTNELSKAIDIKIGDRTELDDGTISDSIPSTLVYIDKEGNTKEINKDIIYIKSDNKYSLKEYLCSELFYKNESEPMFIIRSYDYEQHKDQDGYTDIELVENEIEEENKPWNKIVDEIKIYIPQFDKYNSDAGIYFYEYADGHVFAEYGAVKGIYDKDGKIAKERIREKLFYPHMTKDNILDLYLADTERVKRNEKYLSEGNRYYKK